MVRSLVILLLSLSIAACGGPPRDADLAESVALLLAPSGKGDRSYNDMALAGLEIVKESSEFEAIDLLPASQADYEGVVRDLAESGTDLIIGVGFTYVDAFAEAASDYPDVSFLLIDGELPEEPNVRSIQFRPEEGSFLAGVVAARMTESNSVAFIGGMDIPIINRFRCGFEDGIDLINQRSGKDVSADASYVGSTPNAFANPAAGRDIARLLYSAGTDVIYHAAGKSGNGVIQAAAEQGKYVIGVDTDQSYLAPAAVITSMRKRIDLAVADGIRDLVEGAFEGGIVSLGVKEKGVDLVLDPKGAVVLPGNLIAEIGELSEEIAAGQLKPCRDK